MAIKKFNLDEIDFDEVLKEAVAGSIVGRILASYASTLTNREKVNRCLVYALLQAGKTYSSDLPVIASFTREKKDVKKYSPLKAIKKFARSYPKEAQPLLELLNEKYAGQVPELQYGLKNEKNLSPRYYVAFLSKSLGIPEDNAKLLYYRIIRPEFQRKREESGLVKVVMKE